MASTVFFNYLFGPNFGHNSARDCARIESHLKAQRCKVSFSKKREKIRYFSDLEFLRQCDVTWISQISFVKNPKSHFTRFFKTKRGKNRVWSPWGALQRNHSPKYGRSTSKHKSHISACWTDCGHTSANDFTRLDNRLRAQKSRLSSSFCSLKNRWWLTLVFFYRSRASEKENLQWFSWDVTLQETVIHGCK